VFTLFSNYRALAQRRPWRLEGSPVARVIIDPTGLLSDTRELDHLVGTVNVSTWNASAASACPSVGQKL
jgi:hypothetical protein